MVLADDQTGSTPRTPGSVGFVAATVAAVVAESPLLPTGQAASNNDTHGHKTKALFTKLYEISRGCCSCVVKWVSDEHLIEPASLTAGLVAAHWLTALDLAVETIMMTSF